MRFIMVLVCHIQELDSVTDSSLLHYDKLLFIIIYQCKNTFTLFSIVEYKISN